MGRSAGHGQDNGVDFSLLPYGSRRAVSVEPAPNSMMDPMDDDEEFGNRRRPRKDTGRYTSSAKKKK